MSLWKLRIATCLLLFNCLACASGDDDELADSVNTTPGPTMRPGENCLRCHNPLGEAKTRVWSAAGTVFPMLDAERTEGVAAVDVVFSDENGKVVTTVTTNDVGNFYTAAPLPDPFFVRLEFEGERIEMPCAPPAGSCNACHSKNPVGFAPGRIYLPGAHPPSGPFDCEDWQAGGSGRP